MRQKKISSFGLISLVLSTALFSSPIFSCTGIQLKSEDNAFVNGRTVEFGIPLKISGLFVPRAYQVESSTGKGPGLSYNGKYAVLGATAFDSAFVVDGLNEKGLSAAMFYFPGYASYTPLQQDNEKKAMAPTEFVHWILTQFANVEEVKAGLHNAVIVPVAEQNWGGVPPFHYIVYDQSGKSLVIEPLKGKLVCSDNPIGVFTNSPSFDWHLTNLSNYISLSPFNVPTKNIDGYQLKQFGEGSGLRGIPGDFTPPSRFVRATVYATTALPAKDAQASVFNLFHLLNQFDIPVGAVRSKENNKVYVESTLATVVKDPKNLKYYFRTYDNQTIQVMDLKDFDWDSKHLKRITFPGKSEIPNLSSSASTVSSN